ncbi:MAG: hypothetical protein WAV04_01550 [Candidatus Microsaccharimonas sp.]
MSTIDIADEADAATNALLDLSAAGKKEVKKRRKEIKDALKVQSEIDYGARLAKRRLQDRIDEAEEVLSQIDPDLPVAPPSTEPVAAPAAVVPEPVITEPEPVAAPAAVVPEPVIDTVVIPAPAPAAVVVTPPAHHWYTNFNPRRWNWHRWGWLIAFATVLALLVAALLWGWFVQDWFFNHDPKWHVAGVILSILHWVGWPALGFFLSGYFTSPEDEVAQPNPPAPPAAVPVA